MTDLPIKDLQALRAQYVEQREDVKKAAELEERDLNDTDVAEMERLAKEIRKVDVQLKVKREDAKIAESAVLAGEAGRGGEHELRKMNKRFNLGQAVRELAQGKRVSGVAAEYTEEAMKEARMSGVTLKGQLSIPDVALRTLGGAGEFGAGIDAFTKAGNAAQWILIALLIALFLLIMALIISKKKVRCSLCSPPCSFVCVLQAC